jgi:hypothetical protein
VLFSIIMAVIMIFIQAIRHDVACVDLINPHEWKRKGRRREKKSHYSKVASWIGKIPLGALAVKIFSKCEKLF